MSRVHVERALDGKQVHFRIVVKHPHDAIPRFCTFCGSQDLTEGYLGSYDEKSIRCKNCGLQIHDCCIQPDYQNFKEFMKEKKGGIGKQ